MAKDVDAIKRDAQKKLDDMRKKYLAEIDKLKGRK